MLSILNLSNEYREQFFSNYFQPKAFEKDGKIYEAIGIKGVQKMVLAFGSMISRRFHMPNPYLLGGRSVNDLESFKQTTIASEAIHTIQILALIPSIAEGIFLGSPILTTISVVSAISAGSLIILQRYHRTRIHGILDRKKLRNLNSSE